MSPDEQAIRTLIATWMEATAAGDLDRILELMDDEVVFLGPGRPPMRGKAAFAANTRAMAGKVEVRGSADIQEVRAFGDWAYAWVQLTVGKRDAGGGETTELAGPALSVLRRLPGGRWVMFRDANMIAPVR